MPYKHIFVLLTLISTTAFGSVSKQSSNKSAKDERTPLMACILKKQAKPCEAMILNGQYINDTRRDGVSPLMLAAIFNMNSTVEALVTAGAKVNAKIETAEFSITKGLTALMFAAENGNPQTTRLLIKHGAQLNVSDANGMTPLMFALKSENLQTIKSIIDAGGLDDAARNIYGDTAISIAYRMSSEDTYQYVESVFRERTLFIRAHHKANCYKFNDVKITCGNLNIYEQVLSRKYDKANLGKDVMDSFKSETHPGDHPFLKRLAGKLDFLNNEVRAMSLLPVSRWEKLSNKDKRIYAKQLSKLNRYLKENLDTTQYLYSCLNYWSNERVLYNPQISLPTLAETAALCIAGSGFLKES